MKTTVDQKEIANLHELEMRKLEIEEMKANAELLKYQCNYKDNERSSHAKTYIAISKR